MKKTKVPKTRKKRDERVKRGIYIFPSILTSLSLFCGFLSVIFSTGGDYFYSSVLILVAFFFDGIDGKVARSIGTSTLFGIEYDSLSDLLAFGIAPAILAYNWALEPFGRWGLLICFLYILCAALRLARFNAMTSIKDSLYFRGLPTPAASSLIASTIILYHYMDFRESLKDIILIMMLIALSILMVSNIKYYSFKDLKISQKKSFRILVLVLLAAIILGGEIELMILSFFLFYTFSGPVGWAYQEIRIKTKKRLPRIKEAH